MKILLHRAMKGSSFEYHLLVGGGASLLLMSGIVVINREFTDRRTVAMGLASTGSSIGTLVLPLLTSWWIDVYNWRGSFILLGGLCLQGAVAGALLYSAQKRPACQKQRKGMLVIPPIHSL